MVGSARWIRRFHKPRTISDPLLVVCPHAGSGASVYRRFSAVLGEHFEVVVLQYPGRQDRVAEPMPPTLPEVAAAAFAEFTDSSWRRGCPVTLFGHSMGAVVAFELARLAEAADIPVRLLGVSGSVAPWQVVDKPPHPTEDELLLDHLGHLGGTGTEALDDTELMRMTLPAVKADYAAFDAYACPRDVTVGTGIHVMGGSTDKYVGIGDLFSWQEHTAHELTATIFDGGHFYLHDHVATIAGLLSGESVTV